MADIKRAAVNVTVTASTQDCESRFKLLEYFNKILCSNLIKIEEFGNGDAYCQLMSLLFQGTINLNKVSFNPVQEYERLCNFKILQTAFAKVNVQKDIPVEKLVKCRIADNYEFLQWFYRFFQANFCSRLNRQHYDAVAARGGQVLCAGAFKASNQRKSRSLIRSVTDKKNVTPYLRNKCTSLVRNCNGSVLKMPNERKSDATAQREYEESGESSKCLELKSIVNVFQFDCGAGTSLVVQHQLDIVFGDNKKNILLPEEGISESSCEEQRSHAKALPTNAEVESEISDSEADCSLLGYNASQESSDD